MNNDQYFGNGIVRSSGRPLAIITDMTGKEYVCDQDCADNFDSSRSFEEQSCSCCSDNPFDLGG